MGYAIGGLGSCFNPSPSEFLPHGGWHIFFIAIAQFGAVLTAWERNVNTFIEKEGKWGEQHGLLEVGDYCQMGCKHMVELILASADDHFNYWLARLDVVHNEMERVTKYITIGRSWWGNGAPLYL